MRYRRREPIHLIAQREGGDSPADRQQQLRDGHAAWLAQPEETRGKFNATWLESNGYSGLVDWTRRHDGIVALVESVGGAVVQDFTKQQIVNTEATAAGQLVQAYEVWQAEPAESRGKFNVTWLSTHGYATLYNWTKTRPGGLRALAEAAGPEVAAALEVREKYEPVSPDLAGQRLREAYETWSALPEAERGRFNVSWLRQNGYAGLYDWAHDHGGIVALVAGVGGEIADNFEYAERKKRTPESAVAELITAHATWASQPVESRGQFNTTWLNDNGFNPLASWSMRNTSLEELAKQAGEQVAADFTRLERRENFTLETAAAVLRQAHAQWQAAAEKSRETFNYRWLRRNHLTSAHNWANRNNLLQEVLAAAGAEVVRDYERAERSEHTQESAVAALRQAYQQWRALPEGERGKFTVAWLLRNNFQRWYDWALGHGGIAALVTAAGGPLAVDFERERTDYTPELVREQLNQAHTAWAAIPAENRPPFNPAWLRQNGYTNLYTWIKVHGGIDEWIAATGGAVEADFEKREVGKTRNEYLELLRQAHAQWNALPEEDRRRFNVKWLRVHGYGGMATVVQRQEGGLEALAAEAGADVAADFERRERRAPYTLESAMADLRAAHAAWSAEPAETQGNFTSHWLVQHGYSGLASWAKRQETGLRGLAVAAGEAIAVDLSEQEPSVGYDETTARTALEQAYEQWRQEPTESRGRFNISWLRANGHKKLVKWANRSGGMDVFVEGGPTKIAADFEYFEKHKEYTEESALTVLWSAYNDWLSENPDTREPLTVKWLIDNGYRGIYDWTLSHGGLPTWVEKAGGDLAKAFTIREVRRLDLESANALMREAHEKWRAFPEEDRGELHRSWLQQNGYQDLVSWVLRQGGFDTFIAHVGGEVAKDFSIRHRREAYTLESAVAELAEAHEDWLTAPDTEREPWNAAWLRRHGYAGLYAWAKTQGGMTKLLTAADPTVRQDFRTTSLAETLTREERLAELREAHALWLGEPAGTRGRFNTQWLKKNGYANFYHWAQRAGGIQAVVQAAGEAIVRDFSFMEKAKPQPKPDATAPTPTQPAPEPPPERAVQPEPATPLNPPQPGAPHPERRIAGGYLQSEEIDFRDVAIDQLEPTVAPVDTTPQRELTGRPAVAKGERGAPNPVQELRLLLGRAHRTGEWSDDLVDRFIELHSYQPDYIFHQLAANDVYARAARGEVAMPTTILSVAGGAYGEAIAWYRLRDKLVAANQDLPIAVNLDNSTRMLVRAGQKIRQEYGIPDDLMEGVYGDMRALKESVLRQYHAGDFDLIEFSGLHYAPIAEQPTVLGEAVDLLKPGQLLRIVAQQPITPELRAAVESRGATILTAEETVLAADASALAGLTDDQRTRLGQKIGRGRPYLLAVKNPEPAAAVEPSAQAPGEPDAPPTTAAAAIRPAEQQARKRLRRLRAKPMEKRSRALIALVNELGMKNIPDESLAELGYRKRLIRGRGSKPDTTVIELVTE